MLDSSLEEREKNISIKHDLETLGVRLGCKA